MTYSASYGTIETVKLKTVEEFDDWLNSLSTKQEAQVRARLTNIELYEHFGNVKHLGDSLIELKWKSGMRVYFTHARDSKGRLLLLLLGGHKNAQKKDIKEARKLLEKYSS